MKFEYLIAFLCSITLTLTASAQTINQATSDALPIAAAKPYEIVIRRNHTRSDLRQMIEKVEEDWFARFNELNSDDYYDVYCYEYVPTMSHIKQRVCEPLFMISSRSDNASDVAFLLGGRSTIWATNSQNSSAISLPPQAMRKEKHSDYEILEEKLAEFMRNDEEFHNIGNVLGELKYRLKNYKKE